jgi:hypothetical protein
VVFRSRRLESRSICPHPRPLWLSRAKPGSAAEGVEDGLQVPGALAWASVRECPSTVVWKSSLQTPMMSPPKPKGRVVRTSLFVLPLVMAATFLLGEATAPDAGRATPTARVFTGRAGDAFRVPAAATRCVVSQEGGATNTICRHMPLGRARYSVVFYRDNLLVYRNGRPDNPVFSANGRP